MPFAPKQRFRGGGGGGGGGAVGLTDGQTITWAGGGGGGGGGVEVVGPGISTLVLGSARTACALLISFRPNDKSVSRVRELINRARLTSAENAKATANPNTNWSCPPKSPIFSAH